MTDIRRCPTCGGEIAAEAPQGICPKCLLDGGLRESQTGCGVSPDDAPTAATPPGGFTPPSIAELAQRFPHLEILELIGRGGMGAVYKARQPVLDRLVALKVLPPEVRSVPDFAERFQREARSLARLSHPHIVAVYDFGQADGLYYFLMEYVEGATLRQVLAGGQLAADEALAIVPQICDALQCSTTSSIRSLEHEPEQRYQHASEVKTDVQKIGQQSPPAATTANLGAPAADDAALKAALTARLKGPAWALALYAVFNLVSLAAAFLVAAAIDHNDPDGFDEAALMMFLGAVLVVNMPSSGVMLVGAARMASGESQGMARAGAILAMLPLSLAFPLGIPLGVWVLSVLSRPDVQRASGETRTELVRRGRDEQERGGGVLSFLEAPLAWRWYLAVAAVTTVLLLAGWAQFSTEAALSEQAVAGFFLVIGGFAGLLWIVGRTADPSRPTRAKGRAWAHYVAGALLLLLAIPWVPKLPLVHGDIWYRRATWLNRAATDSVPGGVTVTIPTAPEKTPLVHEGDNADWWFGGVPARLVAIHGEVLMLEMDQPLPRRDPANWSDLRVKTPSGGTWMVTPQSWGRRSQTEPYFVSARFASEGMRQLFVPSERDVRAAGQFSLVLFLWTILFMHRTWRPLRRLLGLSTSQAAARSPKHRVPLARVATPRDEAGSLMTTEVQTFDGAPSATTREPTLSARRRPDPQAQSYVKLPASLLIVLANLNVVILLALLVKLSEKVTGDDTAFYGAVGLAILLVINIPLSGLMWLGGARLWDLESWRLVRTATVLAMLPLHPGFPLGIALGIWIFSELSRPEVRRAFGQAEGGEAPPAHSLKAQQIHSNQ